jgi:DNA-binding transcriptional LysR family regulator
MELRQLRYFLAVAEHLHFTDAAAHLGIAQPPLSQQILKLEREIGTKLFIRHPRRVELTEAGCLLRESAQRIVDEAQRAIVEVRNAGRGESGAPVARFRRVDRIHPAVAALMQRYRDRYENVLIGCEEGNSAQMIEEVCDRKLDAALVRVPLNCRDLVVEPLIEEDMLVVLPPGHRLSKRRRIDLVDLASDPFILYPRSIGPNLYDAMIAARQAAGFAPSISMHSPQISSAAKPGRGGLRRVDCSGVDPAGPGKGCVVSRTAAQAAHDRHLARSSAARTIADCAQFRKSTATAARG